jgi:hypothetical protein
MPDANIYCYLISRAISDLHVLRRTRKCLLGLVDRGGYSLVLRSLPLHFLLQGLHFRDLRRFSSILEPKDPEM